MVAMLGQKGDKAEVLLEVHHEAYVQVMKLAAKTSHWLWERGVCSCLFANWRTTSKVEVDQQQRLGGSNSTP